MSQDKQYHWIVWLNWYEIGPPSIHLTKEEADKFAGLDRISCTQAINDISCTQESPSKDQHDRS